MPLVTDYFFARHRVSEQENRVTVACSASAGLCAGPRLPRAWSSYSPIMKWFVLESSTPHKGSGISAHAPRAARVRSACLAPCAERGHGFERLSAVLLETERGSPAKRVELKASRGRLTSPSSGRPPAGFASFRPPLMSDVRQHAVRALGFCGLACAVSSSAFARPHYLSLLIACASHALREGYRTATQEYSCGYFSHSARRSARSVALRATRELCAICVAGLFLLLAGHG